MFFAMLRMLTRLPFKLPSPTPLGSASIDYLVQLDRLRVSSDRSEQSQMREHRNLREQKSVVRRRGLHLRENSAPQRERKRSHVLDGLVHGD